MTGMDGFLGDGTAGMLFPVGDIHSMIEGCLSILTNPGLALEMGKAGRKRVVEQYHEDIIVDRYEQLYRDVIRDISS